MTRKPQKSKIDEEIDRNLKRAFEDLANAPVPDRFADLLARLRAQDETERGDKDD